MNKETQKKIISEYLAGKASPEQVKLLEEWFYSFDDEEVTIFSELPIDKEKFKESLFNKINEKIQKPELVEKKSPKIILWRQVMPWAASILLFLSLGLGIYIFKAKPETDDYQISSTMKGAKLKKIELIDGSVVYLNSGSSLRYPKQFSSSLREVFLEGEAFFKVTKNPQKPFLIHTGKVQTKVLGTSFNVKAFQDDKSVEVTVMTGKVRVFDNKTEVILTPNQKAIYETTSGKLLKQEVTEIANYNAWMKGTLVFEKKSMKEIVKDLNRHFNVEIKLEGDKIKKYELNVRFENDSLETILQILCSYTDAKYKRTGDVIVITGK